MLSDGGGCAKTARVLLDPCSEATLVSLDLARKLGCRLRRTHVGITGVTGPATDSARHQATLHIWDPTKQQQIGVDALVLRTIGIFTSSEPLSTKLTMLRKSLLLADPTFNQPGKVDAVVGADVYHRVMLTGTIRLGSLLAQNTIFGWTLMGSASPMTPSSGPLLCSQACTTATDAQPEAESSHEKLLALVQRFLSLEEVPVVRRISVADRECEKIYTEGVHRGEDGRYVVRLPMKAERVALLGESLPQAQSALLSMQRRMQKDPELKESYCKFMEEYARLGHMRELSTEEIETSKGSAYYIQHHGIWQRSDNGRKLRVVFNASRATSSALSLNDALHSGPKLQSHIATVITRWRRHRFVFCADVQMMFRQIRIDERDVHLQRIVWRSAPEGSTKHFALQTVTYGTACAPYLALRTMQQLSSDEGDRFPLARETLERDLYMDDFLSGSHDLNTTRRLRDQLIGLLKAGGFHLRKWVANDPELLADIPPEDRLRPSWVHLPTDGPVSELGVSWDPVDDRFKFRAGQNNPAARLTKRTALAELASVFDPAGWLTPLTLVAKLIIQDLWRAKFDWDEDLPKAWRDKWLAFRSSLQGASEFSLERWLGHAPGRGVQLHAFADASKRALAAVVYSRTAITDTNFETVIIGAKTKLASIKSLQPATRARARMTTPRLELQAALIAAYLLRNSAAALQIPMSACHLWSDSQVALHWLRSEDPAGNDLVDNYVAHIQELTVGVTFHHVPTDWNPADVASRGTDSVKLALHPHWWTGPKWLSSSESEWLEDSVDDRSSSTTPEATASCFATTVPPDSPRLDRTHISRFSSLGALLRGTTRALRLLQAQGGVKPLAPVTAAELRQAFIISARLSQRQTFATEFIQLSRGEPLRGPTPLKSLEPFIDDDGVLRVGGRLGCLPLPFDERHPILLDGRSHLAQLVIRWAHERSLHGGFRATYARTIQRAWITGGKVRVKRHLRMCSVCARLAARTSSQLMATLPPARVTPSRPFTKCGVDYAGPFPLCRSKGRGVPTVKGYVALFVCMSTKAIHLELVGDLTTASFLGALTRFIGRRGRPAEIWSDNGTNFRGADLELRRLLREAELDWNAVEGTLASEGGSWKFIPPAAPHFGGLWEAGVKSMKRHLQRIAAPRRLTYEEFSTLLVSVEMVLNSRPLFPPAGDLGDLEALTPSHFLTGTSATSYPQPASLDIHLDKAVHWELVQAMRGHFWDRWSREYLNTLIQRPKWRKPQTNLEVGDFVVVVDPSLLRPDGRWPLGRVTSTHPGSDGLVRAVTVKTSTGEYTRPIVKIARLPCQDDKEALEKSGP